MTGRHLLRGSMRVAVMTLALASTACSVAPPRAWEKDLLARPGMAMDGDALDRRFQQHIYSSKENSSGGDGVGGGGCGCN